LIADSQRLLADALGIALALQPDIDAIPEYPGGGPETIDSVLLFRPDVALLDQWLIGMDGPAVARSILERVPKCKLIIMSWFYRSDHVQSAFDAGAVGFLPKSLEVVQLADAIRRAQAGESPVYGKELEGLVKNIEKRDQTAHEAHRKLVSLAPQEMRILILLSLGLTAEDVSDRLSIGLGTVRNYIQKILKKTGAHSQMEAIAMAQQYGMIQGGQGGFGEPGPPAQAP